MLKHLPERRRPVWWKHAEGTFIGWLANGLIVEFDSGKEGLFLACDLKKINTIEEVNISL